MRITIELPDEIAESLGPELSLSRRLLEAYAIEGYRSEKLTRRQVGQLLGLDRWKAEEFLAEHGATRAYSLADWELDRRSLEQASEE
ncbi:MAG: UPF0175 family protein [Verrucomicrobia bacterium]|nr:UPF0175 family protein [Verrucomicrobiota bacterium]